MPDGDEDRRGDLSRGEVWLVQPNPDRPVPWCCFSVSAVAKGPPGASAVDDLRDAEGFEALDAEFQAVAGLFGAAEGNTWVDGSVFVDPHRAGLDPCCHFAGSFQVRRPD